MKNKVDITWTEDMSFEALVNDHKIVIDAVEAVGGKDRGPRPKPLMLLSLGGCTGMDVVSILKKMRVDYDGLKIEVEGELTDEHPKVYHTITLNYIFKGSNLPMEKLEKAVSLSQERYCGVTAMLQKAATIKHNIIVEG
jgi:putative redox protein